MPGGGKKQIIPDCEKLESQICKTLGGSNQTLQNKEDLYALVIQRRLLRRGEKGRTKPRHVTDRIGWIIRGNGKERRHTDNANISNSGEQEIAVTDQKGHVERVPVQCWGERKKGVPACVLWDIVEGQLSEKYCRWILSISTWLPTRGTLTSPHQNLNASSSSPLCLPFLISVKDTTSQLSMPETGELSWTSSALLIITLCIQSVPRCWQRCRLYFPGIVPLYHWLFCRHAPQSSCLGILCQVEIPTSLLLI